MHISPNGLLARVGDAISINFIAELASFFDKVHKLKSTLKAAIVALSFAAFAVPSFAEPRNDHDQDDRKIPHHSVPEINGAGASLALALVGGMILISRERRKIK